MRGATLGHFWTPLGNSRPRWVTLVQSGSLWSSLVHWSTLDHSWPLWATPGILGHPGPFWHTLRPLWSSLGHSGTTLVHSSLLWSTKGNFEPLWYTLGHLEQQRAMLGRLGIFGAH